MNKLVLSGIVCVALVTLTVACGPAATPMAIPTDTPSPVPPTATPSPTLVPTSTPLPTLTPVPPTLTPSPLLPTLTPTPLPPTATPKPPTPIPTATPTLEPCYIVPIRGFGKVWDENPSARAYVGCPYYSREKGMDFIAQRFQHGVIFWMTGPDYPTWEQGSAYVLFRDNGTFIRVPVSWGTGQPAPIPTPTSPPTEPFEPLGNLAEVWREGPGVKTRLGLAVEAEKSGNGAWQEFWSGWMFWIPYKQGTPDDMPGKPFEQRDRWIYVLADYWPYPPGGVRNDWLEFLDTWQE